MRGLSALTSDSADSVRHALVSIEKKGYLTRRQMRDGAGRLTGSVYSVCDSARGEPLTENPLTAASSKADPSTGERGAYNKRSSKKKQNKKPLDGARGSFDTEDFFRAALRRSYGDDFQI